MGCGQVVTALNTGMGGGAASDCRTLGVILASSTWSDSPIIAIYPVASAGRHFLMSSSYKNNNRSEKVSLFIVKENWSNDTFSCWCHGFLWRQISSSHGAQWYWPYKIFLFVKSTLEMSTMYGHQHPFSTFGELFLSSTGKHFIYLCHFRVEKWSKCNKYAYVS